MENPITVEQRIEQAMKDAEEKVGSSPPLDPTDLSAQLSRVSARSMPIA